IPCIVSRPWLQKVRPALEPPARVGPPPRATSWAVWRSQSESSAYRMKPAAKTSHGLGTKYPTAVVRSNAGGMFESPKSTRNSLSMHIWTSLPKFVTGVSVWIVEESYLYSDPAYGGTP